MKTLVHTVEWKPQLSLLNPEELASACCAQDFGKDESAVIAASIKISLALDIVVARTLARVTVTPSRQHA